MGSWRHLLSIRQPAIHMLMLEVFMSFEFNRSHTSFIRDCTILFLAFDQYHSMSVTQFSVHHGLYDADYIDTEEYAQLSTDYLHGLTPQLVYRILCGDG